MLAATAGGVHAFDGVFYDYVALKFRECAEEVIDQFTTRCNLAIEVVHLMEKTNFCDAIALGVSKLGRSDLAGQLRKARITADEA